MTKLDELIAELCPDGVEYKKLGDAVSVERGKRVVKSQLSEFQGFPVYQNSLVPLGYHVESNYSANTTFVIMAGAAGEIGYSNEDFWAADDCFSIVCPDSISDRYIYHILLQNQATLKAQVRKASIPRLSRTALDKLNIPVPPLPVQREIVRILDNFTDLTADLTAELTARKKQYEFYRDKLLAVKSVGSDVVLLGDIASIHTGSKPDKILDTISEYEYINAGTSNSGYAEQPNCDEDTVTTPSRGQGGIGYIGYQSKPFYLGPLCYAIRSKSQEFMINKYIYHWLISHSSDILTLKNEGGTPALNKTDLAKIKIVAPPLSIQQRIVNVLDNFDAICSDLNIGLPAEIEARQKQYEYYRDKLLSFKELKP